MRVAGMFGCTDCSVSLMRFVFCLICLCGVLNSSTAQAEKSEAPTEKMVEGVFGETDSFTEGPDAAFCFMVKEAVSIEYARRFKGQGRFCIPLPVFNPDGTNRNSLVWHYRDRRIGVGWDWFNWRPDYAKELASACSKAICSIRAEFRESETAIFISSKTPIPELAVLYNEEYFNRVRREMENEWELSQYDWDGADVDITGFYPPAGAFSLGARSGSFVVQKVRQTKPGKAKPKKDTYTVYMPYYEDRVSWSLNGYELQSDIDEYYVPLDYRNLDDECGRKGQKCTVRVIKQGKTISVLITAKLKLRDPDAYYYVEEEEDDDDEEE